MSDVAISLPVVCCPDLCSKAMYFSADERPGLLRENPEHTYWCAHTHDPAGPDGLDAMPTKCQSGRTCFRAE